MKVYLVIYAWCDGGYDIQGLYKNKKDAEDASIDASGFRYEVVELELRE